LHGQGKRENGEQRLHIDLTRIPQEDFRKKGIDPGKGPMDKVTVQAETIFL